MAKKKKIEYIISKKRPFMHRAFFVVLVIKLIKVNKLVICFQQDSE